jgi:hypothetical protein
MEIVNLFPQMKWKKNGEIIKGKFVSIAKNIFNTGILLFPFSDLLLDSIEEFSPRYRMPQPGRTLFDFKGDDRNVQR